MAGCVHADQIDLGVIYAYTFNHDLSIAHDLLRKAVDNLLVSIEEHPAPSILWRMQYDQRYTVSATTGDYDLNIIYKKPRNDRVLQLPDLMPGLTLEDDVLKHVRACYDRIMEGHSASFMTFTDREGAVEINDEDNEE